MVKLIVGLGNPGIKYKDTRHNVGFKVIDRCLCSDNLVFSFKKFSYGEFFSASLTIDEKIIKCSFLKPLTYMNESGVAVSQIVRYLKILPSEILVVHDELDLPFGRIKLKAGGGTAGHNGLKSICQALKDKNFLRLRIGIGRPMRDEDIASFVLSGFYSEQKKVLDKILDVSKQAVFTCLDKGFHYAQEKFNAKNTFF
ncbi:MAG: aminoacyl-tRNA hydrolase [Desulfonauticus sp.]|nr:aminoacyl-tRNA hydrolase [Desulfonauticus sp.]